MYPSVESGYDRLVARLNFLLDHQLFEEAVVASSQTIERTLKRVVIREMNRQGLCLQAAGKSLCQLESTMDRDRAIGALARHDALRRAWRVLVAEPRQQKPLDACFNDVVHNNAWSVLIATKGHELSGQWLHCGLRECRHRLVHGQHAVRERELTALAPWGVQASLALLHPQEGLVREIGWNPQNRLPPLRLWRRDPSSQSL